MNSYKKIMLFIALLALPLTINGEDYQYQYFNGEKDKYVPFSDYIPKVRLHYKTVPHYVEDFYLLYGMKQYYNENSLRKNIAYLSTALECKFRHPSEAFVKIETENEYLKYRRLIFMHINLLIMRNHMTIASKYDKRKIYFYNLDFAHEIRDSLDIAEKYYKEAVPYWERAKQYARDASEIKRTLDMGTVETERYKIIRGELDFGKIINTHLSNVSKKKNKLDSAIASSNIPDNRDAYKEIDE